MPANITPIFPLTPKVSWTTLTTANTAKDGTGTVGTCYTAGTNGARVDYLKVRALGTNVATVLRDNCRSTAVIGRAGGEEFLVAEIAPASPIIRSTVLSIASVVWPGST